MFMAHFLPFSLSTWNPPPLPHHVDSIEHVLQFHSTSWECWNVHVKMLAKQFYPWGQKCSKAGFDCMRFTWTSTATRLKHKGGMKTDSQTLGPYMSHEHLKASALECLPMGVVWYRMAEKYSAPMKSFHERNNQRTDLQPIAAIIFDPFRKSETKVKHQARRQFKRKAFGGDYLPLLKKKIHITLLWSPWAVSSAGRWTMGHEALANWPGRSPGHERLWKALRLWFFKENQTYPLYLNKLESLENKWMFGGMILSFWFFLILSSLSTVSNFLYHFGLLPIKHPFASGDLFGELLAAQPHLSQVETSFRRPRSDTCDRQRGEGKMQSSCLVIQIHRLIHLYILTYLYIHV